MRKHPERHSGLFMRCSTLAVAALALAFLPAMDAVAQSREIIRDHNGMPPIPMSGPGRVGARVERVRLTLPVDPVLVVVPDGDAYIEAVARWSTEHRFPILIDDGTPGARENIARFVRAFEPEQVLLWPGSGGGAGSIRERMETAFHRAWGADSDDSIRAVWNEMRIQPPGVVVTAEGDTAWPAALALAAGRGQPILWVGGRMGGAGGVSKNSTYEWFDKQVRDQFQGIRFTWSQIGDDIDAISVCMNMPTRVFMPGPKKEVVALTDRLGRFEDGRIYAWSGIIIGTEAESAYRAMSALFLQPEEFWLFNGYSTTPPYDGYTMRPVEGFLRKVGLKARMHSPPRNDVDDWRAATRTPLSAGFVSVNASGHRGWFDLNPGKAHTSDTPFLDKPAAVYFIHSFSAQNLDDRDSIARRWLDNGAYAYAGAVDEPYLQGFTPPAYVVPGLYSPVPLGVMVRPNSDKPWKVNTIGDPLITFGPRARRTGQIPDLPGAVVMETSMKSALKERDFATGFRLLVMLGRHEDAAKLGRALIVDDPEALTPEVAEILLRVFYRAGKPDLLTTCYLAMDEPSRQDTVIRDLTWKALGRELISTRSKRILDVLTGNVRDGTFTEDITAITRAIRRVRGDGAALAFLTRLSRAGGLSHERQRFLRGQIDRVNPSRN